MRKAAVITVWVALLPALTSCATTALPADPYQASGFEPGWMLTIEGGRLRYVGPADAEVDIAIPQVRPIARGVRLQSAEIRVEIDFRPCEDESTRVRADTVRVTANGYTAQGCGGRTIRAPAD